MIEKIIATCLRLLKIHEKYTKWVKYSNFEEGVLSEYSTAGYVAPPSEIDQPYHQDAQQNKR